MCTGRTSESVGSLWPSLACLRCADVGQPHPCQVAGCILGQAPERGEDGKFLGPEVWEMCRQNAETLSLTRGGNGLSTAANDVPTHTGTTPAARVLGRIAETQILRFDGRVSLVTAPPTSTSSPLRCRANGVGSDRPHGRSERSQYSTRRAQLPHQEPSEDEQHRM